MWMRDFFGLQTSRSRGKLDASEILAPRRNAQEILTFKKRVNIFIFRIADGRAKLLGRDHESTLQQYDLVESEDLSQELQRNSDGS